MTPPRVFRSAWADLVLGEACAGCAAPGSALCGRCRGALEALPSPHRPRPCPAGLPAVYGVTAYDGIAKRILLAHKEQGRLPLAKPLGRALAASVAGVLSASAPAGGDIHLVPVPSRRAVVRERGHQPLLRVARECRTVLRTWGVTCSVSVPLRVRRHVDDQAGLDARARRANVEGAIGIRRRRSPAGWEVIVVDDIVTTGATIAEMTRALTAAGADVLGAAVIATTPRDAWRPGASGQEEA